MNILVSGSSIAGPAAAYWLHRAGHQVTVIERSPRPRLAGQNVDVRGAGRQVLRLMNLEDSVLQRNTGEIGVRFVDDDDRVLLELPAGQSDDSGATAEMEVLRGELSAVLLDALPEDVIVHFGRRITSLCDDTDSARVTFNDGTEQNYDLVVVAEGTRSSTRQLVFGDVPTRPLGLYVAFGTIPRSADDDKWWYWYNATGGRSVNVRPDNKGTTRVSLSFLSPSMGYEDCTVDEQKALLAETFSDVGWRVPHIVEALQSSDELYVDNLTQVRARDYARGRVVLLGDAAWGPTPISGRGATLALTGAYLLAGELGRNASVDVALRAYQEAMSEFVSKAQHLPPGAPRLAHPTTRLELSLFRALLRIAGSTPVRTVARLLPERRPRDRQLIRYDD